MNPLVVIAAVVSVLVGISSFFFGKRYAEGQQALETSIEQRSRDAALKVTAEAISGIQVRNTTIRQRVETQLRENTVYRDCVIDPTTQRLLDDARANRDPEPAGGSVVPGTAPNGS